ncbi:MAG: alpha-L-fucosidase, partial [Armatimonadota bacterium]|nr:alpha-L-fucosidase [Armatimonadota bacterium]
TAQAADEALRTDGPFQPSWASLQKYQCPEWFRDAKFGIWAHWTAQCVPEQGDWYARQMYQEGSHDYQYQCEHYGHPSKVGFKDIDHIWHAEHWDPERLIGLYKAAGAKYFVALANHHDNFDTWNSKYQNWNSVNLGPKKDIIATWEKLARKNGMHFGVTVHAARTWDWFDVSHRADKTGPLAGVPYDGVLTKADGKGQWWDGYDPAELYGPAGAARTPEAHAQYERKFFNRVMDLLDQHRPDLLYFDDGEPPTSYGLQIAANYYNKNRQWHKGALEAILNVKGGSPRVKESMVLDYERGRSDKIAEHPWQTDTCIGQWHYQRSVYENHQYKTADQVVKMLVDIVAKNGNLLLNIPLRGDGTIDPDELAFLQGMAAWMAVNSEAIFGTRPWKIAGEGQVRVKGGGFSEGGENKFTAQDIRFTTKGNTLYATALGWPEDGGKYVVKTLAANAPGIVGQIKSVQLLGAHGKAAWKRTADGLEVTLPAQKPCDHAWALKIEGLNLAASQPAPPVTPAIHAAADGTLTLPPDGADLTGAVQFQNNAVPNIGIWDDPKDTVGWRVHFDAPGDYAVTAKVSAASGGTAFVLDAGGGAAVTFAVPKTDSWDDYQTVTGTLKIDKIGDTTITARSADPAAWHAMNLATVILKPAK